MPGPKAGAKPKKPRAYKLPKPLPEGEVLVEHSGKRSWRIGSIIGQGGFGYIYLASDNVNEKVNADAQYVLKIEPQGNGPLFVELHFYQRSAKEEMLEKFRKSKKLPYLGVPKFISTGLHETSGVKYRFMVMQRFGEDLYKKLQKTNQKFSPKVTYMLAKRILNTLEYLHESGYIHADIKAANLMMGYGPKASNQVFLVDYGLAHRYLPDGQHKPYKEDPRKAHDGTLEYTSRDAHKGVLPSRRADIEILGYNILHWLSGKLPWQASQDPDRVSAMKHSHMSNIRKLMEACFDDNNFAGKDEVEKYLKYVQNLKYEEKPDYNHLRQLFESALSKNNMKDDGKFTFENVQSSPVKETKSKLKANGKRKSDGSPRKKSPVKATKQKLKAIVKQKSDDVTNGSPRKRSPVKSTKQKLKAIVKQKSDDVTNGSPRKRIKSPSLMSSEESSPEIKRKRAAAGTKRKATSSSSNDGLGEEEMPKMKKQAMGGRTKKPVCSLSSPETSPDGRASKKQTVARDKLVIKRTTIRNSKRKVKTMDSEIQTSPGLLQRYIDSRKLK